MEIIAKDIDTLLSNIESYMKNTARNPFNIVELLLDDESEPCKQIRVKVSAKHFDTMRLICIIFFSKSCLESSLYSKS